MIGSGEGTDHKADVAKRLKREGHYYVAEKHYPEDGTYVSNDPDRTRDNAHRQLRPGTPGIKHRWHYHWRGQRIEGGFRPSKRKETK